MRRLVEEHALDPSTIEGTGKNGRILKGDVLAFIKKPAPVAVVEAPVAPGRIEPLARRQVGMRIGVGVVAVVAVVGPERLARSALALGRPRSKAVPVRVREVVGAAHGVPLIDVLVTVVVDVVALLLGTVEHSRVGGRAV